MPLFFPEKIVLKIDRSVKMPLHRPSMGAVGPGSWVPDAEERGTSRLTNIVPQLARLLLQSEGKRGHLAGKRQTSRS